jgi:flavin reductase (DIM6/NTAB) family NADH-FMN oxidoreductase RutF/esterase/lipase
VSALTFEGFGGVKLVAEGFGSAENPTVLLLHGGAQSLWIWRHAADVLSNAGRYVIALNLRGHGESQWAPDGRYDIDAYAADLKAVLAQLPSRPFIVGSTLGGMVALAALAGTGDHFAAGLVLVEAGPWLASRADRIAREMYRLAEGYSCIEEAVEAATAFASYRRVKPRDPNVLQRQLVQRGDGKYYWRWDPRSLNGLKQPDLAQQLEAAAARVTVPTLVLHGNESEIFPLSDAARLTEMIPDCERIQIEGAGHQLVSEQSDLFHAALVDFLERRMPRAPREFVAGSDARTLRDALGCFGTGVTVVTTLTPEGKPVGLTANSFTSVSLDPPLLLFCLANSAGSLAAFEECRHFAINVLHIGQQLVSSSFARKIEDRFASGQWTQWDTGVPILTGSLSSFECERYSSLEAGDHHVFIGLVKRACFEPRRDPLLYFRGKYRRLHFA